MNPSTFRIELAKPLLIIRCRKGVLCCGYLNVDTFNATGEACAIVTGVSNFDDMLCARIESLSTAAIALGIEVGDSGANAVAKLGGYEH